VAEGDDGVGRVLAHDRQPTQLRVKLEPI
jgi:hypothetical protein